MAAVYQLAAGGAAAARLGCAAIASADRAFARLRGFQLYAPHDRRN